MMRLVLALCVAACAAFSPASSLQLTQSRAAASSVSMMARAAPKKAAKAAKAAKPAKKAAAPKKSVAKKTYRAAPKGKGGIFPWITNEAGTYANVVSLSSVDFTSDRREAD